MARKSYLRIAGVIENMSAFTCEHGSSYPLFGEGGGDELAHDAGVPLLGKVPLEPAVSLGGDEGAPVVLGEGPAAEAFRAIAERIVAEAVPPDRDGRLHRPHPRRRRDARRARSDPHNPVLIATRQV